MIVPELELPVNLIGADDKTGKTVQGFFNPTEIACYHDGYYPDTGIFIYLKGGQPVQIGLTLEEYRQTLRDYWDKLAFQQKQSQSKQSIKQQLGMKN